MTETLIREREWQIADDYWEVVGQAEDAEGFTRTAEPEADDGGWVLVTEDVNRSEFDVDQRQLVATVLDVLLDDWSRVAAHQSSVRRAARHPIYRLILQAGERAVPELLARLERDVNPLWIWALGDVTGEDPAAGSTTMDEAADAWLRWGHSGSSSH